MITDDHSIIQISALDTYAVRSPVLRPGKPIESCRFDGDDLETTKHFGVFSRETLCGVVSVFSNNTPLVDGTRQLQIRGMAVLPEYRNHRFGAALVQHVETFAKAQNATLLWFNAREIAVGFYEKMGYEVTGEPFSIGDIGTHYVMYKRL